MEKLENYISLEKLEVVCNSIEDAHGLPNECYLEGGYTKFERKLLFEDKWVVIGVASNLKQKGEAVPFNLLGIPLIILKDKNDKIRVFHNVCSHRGYKLLNEPCKIKNALRCPYHSWAYDLNGKLVSTPHIGGMDKNDADGFVKSRSDLIEVRSYVWLDMIFINISGNQIPFDKYIEPLEKRWSKFWTKEDQNLITHAEDNGYFLLEAKCNWKFAIENYCESYHLPTIHPELNKVSNINDHYHIQGLPNRFAGQGSKKYEQPIKGNKKFNTFPNWEKKMIKNSEYIALFPNVMIGLHVDHFYVFWLEPLGMNKTKEHMQMYYIGNESANGNDLKELRKENARFWKDVMLEDIKAIEGMQEGRKSPVYNGGNFSPIMDQPTHQFHKWVANSLI